MSDVKKRMQKSLPGYNYVVFLDTSSFQTQNSPYIGSIFDKGHFDAGKIL